MKTKVILTNDDKIYRAYTLGETGYIDGWVRGGDGAPYACVVINDRIIMCKAHEMRVIGTLE